MNNNFADEHCDSMAFGSEIINEIQDDRMMGAQGFSEVSMQSFAIPTAGLGLNQRVSGRRMANRVSNYMKGLGEMNSSRIQEELGDDHTLDSDRTTKAKYSGGLDDLDALFKIDNG